MVVDCTKKLVRKENLSEDEAYDCVKKLMSGSQSDVAIASFLTALAAKGETVDEITGCVHAMRDASVKVRPRVSGPLVDTCGTGGDKIKTFNVSTLSAIVAASCGVSVAKHGNKSITSKCGSADLLVAMGVNISCDAAAVERCIEQAGIGFMFAPLFHPAMKAVMPVRKALGFRTVFNILGPLSSPANADTQLVGVFDESLVEKMALVLKKLGTRKALVVHGLDSSGTGAMDEISTIGKTKIASVGFSSPPLLSPADFGLPQVDSSFVAGDYSLQDHLLFASDVLHFRQSSPQQKARLEMVLANSSAVLVLAGRAENYVAGVNLASRSIENGAALATLEKLVEVSGGDEKKFAEFKQLA